MYLHKQLKKHFLRIFNALWEISFKLPIGVPTIYKIPFSGSCFLWDNKEIIIHLMIKLPSGVDINNLIDDIRIFSWQAADILLYYSKLLENSDDKRNILKIIMKTILLLWLI